MGTIVAWRGCFIDRNAVWRGRPVWAKANFLLQACIWDCWSWLVVVVALGGGVRDAGGAGVVVHAPLGAHFLGDAGWEAA